MAPLSVDAALAQFKHECARRAAAAGFSRAVTATVLGMSERNISRIRTRTAARRGPKAGSPAQLLRERLVKGIALETKTNGKRTLPAFPSASSIAMELEKRHDISVSTLTVWRDLLKGGAKCLVRPAHPGFRNAAKRAAFANAWKDVRPRKLQRLVFSDEHFISINDHSSRTMYVFPDGNVLLPREMQRRQNVPYFQIWAAIGFGWRSQLVFFPRTQKDEDSAKGYRGWSMTGKSYVQRCLATVRKQLNDHGSIFMQDGARPHTANHTLEYCERHGIKLLEGFPSSSPDMNPIEKVWALLDARIAELMPHDDESLKKAANDAWNAIPQAVLNNFVTSFKSVCRNVAERNGE